jgi:hypothetical protein
MKAMGLTRAVLMAAFLLFGTTALADVGKWAAALAASKTANGPSCTKAQPFYWEIGDATGKLAGGSVGGTTYTATTPVFIASASKIVYGAYVAQKKWGMLSQDDVKHLTFTSGFSDFDGCRVNDTVGLCALHATQETPSTLNLFAYSGGHMQRHADVSMGMGWMGNLSLATEVNTVLGTTFTYNQPQLAGGVATTPQGMAVLLRRIMTNELVLGSLLAGPKVPTVGPLAVNSPVPEPWHYGIGHWIEDAPGNDGAFSSPGAFGFYPWISADKRLYGVVARQSFAGGWTSVQCGRLIRAAYRDGVPR